MNPGGGYRSTPPLLPSTALQGLERFVPPERQTHASLGSSWKFKPLPNLPQQTPNLYDRDIGSGILIARDDSLLNALNDEDEDSNGEQIDDLRHFLDGHFSDKQSASRSSEDLPPQRRLSASAPISQIPSRPESRRRDGQWTLFPSTRPISSRIKRNIVITPKPPEIRVCRPSSPNTINSVHPSLMPAPLAIDGPRLYDHHGHPAPLIPDCIDFCHCHIPDPSHYVTRLGVESPHVQQLETSAGITIRRGSSSYSIPDRESCQLHGRRSMDSQYPNRTRLYSFSSYSRRNTYSDTDSDDGYNFIRNEETFHLTSPDRSLTPPASSHAIDAPTRQLSLFTPSSPTRPFIERRRQLAIPPTDYQKYGAKVFSTQNKQNRVELFPKCMRKLLPRSWREPDEIQSKPEITIKHKHKRSLSTRLKRGGNFRINIEKLPGLQSAYPSPPQDPRPAPFPPTPLPETPPSIPSLVFPSGLGIEAFFSDNGYGYYADSNDGDTPLTPWNGWSSSFSAWNLSREAQIREDEHAEENAGSESIDSRERLVHRSRSALGGYGGRNEQGSFWLL